MKSVNDARRRHLLAATATIALVLPAMPAFAADTPPKPTTVATEDSDNAANEKDIVVTGSLFRRTDTETPSPVTTLTAEKLELRGINTVQDAIQLLSANGAGALPNSFSANGAFASGASAVSLRGLTTSSTLVLFDGLRAAYYPLADDGTRNFVDLNSIPDAIVERIEVLKDGASSTYGADAVAGVVNIITKKQITGVHLNASSGISGQGDSAEQRVDLTVGYGKLDEQGFNVYLSGEYQKNAMLYSRDRGYPYNTSDFSHLCGTSAAGATVCRTNSVVNGTQYDGTYAGIGTTIIPVVRAYNAGNTAAVGARYQLLNAAAGCGSLPSMTLTAAQAASTAGANGALNNCLEDSRSLFSVITPAQERIGLSGRATVNIGSSAQAYAQFNYYQSDVFYTGTPQGIRNNTPAGGVTYSTTSIALPVYICPRNGVSAVAINSVPTTPGCTAANGTLNPNNPFAALGQTARILYQLSDIPLSNERLTKSFRGATGISGTFGDNWNYSLEGTAMVEKLKATYKGYVYVQHLLDEVADGSYNFVNPALNSQAVRDYLTPTRINNSKSEMYQGQVSLQHPFFNLPGGPLQVGIGASVRYEAITAPSANPVNATSPTERYFTINGFGTSGNRTVYSGYFEVNAPVFTQLELNASGRYDSYSSGQSNFSPKFGAKFTPIKQLAIRATFSKGFRIPSFAEAYGLPTTGYITQTPPASYQALCATPKPAYCTASYSLGLTSVGNPNLKPEKSTNFTAGVVFEPVRNVSLSVDYYNIYKKDLITGADYAPQIALYYANAGSTTALANGITGVTQDPNYIAGQGSPYPLLGTIQYGFINANSAKSTGIDFNAETRIKLTNSIKWISSLDATYVIELSQTINGVKQRYDDTLGPYQITSASGTPKWRGSWQNTLDFGRASITATGYYTSGYEEGAEDDGNTRGVCAVGGSYAVYRDGATVVTCRVKGFFYMDMGGRIKIQDKFTLYGNVGNVFNAKAPYDPSTYGGSNYNPAWANAGIIGRTFRVGAKVDF
jgi:iron complex outermembrane receptor protein